MKNQAYDVFDLSPFDITDATSGLLRLYVDAIGRDASRTSTVSRLNKSAKDMDEESITWSSMDAQVVKYGNRFPIRAEHVNNWVEVSVTSLLRAPVTDDNVLVVFLENRGSSSSSSHVIFGSHEGGQAASLILENLGSGSA